MTTGHRPIGTFSVDEAGRYFAGQGSMHNHPNVCAYVDPLDGRYKVQVSCRLRVASFPIEDIDRALDLYRSLLGEMCYGQQKPTS